MIKSLKEIIKATLFVAGEGLPLSSFTEMAECDIKQVKLAVEELKNELKDTSGIYLIEYKDKIQLCSNPAYSSQISVVLNPIREKALTKAALEALAIIAYKQPITKLEIEEIRGVNCDYTVQILLEHKMIEVVGRKDAVGKPLLLGTTEEFLKRFELKDIDDLPKYEELLERIALIKTEEDNKTDSLYREYELSQDNETAEGSMEEQMEEQMEEEIPDFLQGEEINLITADIENAINETTDEINNEDKGAI